MLIVMSQKNDNTSIYSDALFSVYHYPKMYRNTIHEGDIFVYHQSDKTDPQKRYYFGAGRVDSITNDGSENYYAHLTDVFSFDNPVPIRLPNGGYVEQLDYESVRKRPMPPWQVSIRPLSEAAFTYIISKGLPEDKASHLLQLAGLQDLTEQNCEEDIELEIADEYEVLNEGGRRVYYTTRYERNPTLRKQAILKHGTTCMACGFNFEVTYGKRGKDYIEVHHIVPLSTTNGEIPVDPETDLVVLCANCHRMIHRKRSEILSLDELQSLINRN